MARPSTTGSLSDQFDNTMIILIEILHWGHTGLVTGLSAGQSDVSDISHYLNISALSDFCNKICKEETAD